MRSLVVSAAIVLGFAACEGPDVTIMEGRFERQLHPAARTQPPPPAYQPTFELGTSGFSVWITGTLWGTFCGSRADASFHRIGDELLLIVEVVPVSMNCAGSMTETSYRATFLNVPVGKHHVLVEHIHHTIDVGATHDLRSIVVDPIFPQSF